MASMTLGSVNSFHKLSRPRSPSVRSSSSRSRSKVVVVASSPGNVPGNVSPKKVVITGGTGLVGSALASTLTSRGDNVVILTRDRFKARGSVKPAIGKDAGALAFVETQDFADAVRGAYAIVNLAGESISTRWTDEIKREIKSSRIRITELVATTINELPEEDRPKVLVSASALGYYGTSMSATFDEQSPGGTDYLAEVCRDWEAAASAAEVERRVIVRIGIVLSNEGGALAKMVPLFQMFAGGPPGEGSQWFSWIHRDDLVNMLITAIDDSRYEGVVNGVAPSPVRMSEFCSRLGQTLGRPNWLPVPGFALNAVLGEGASVVLDGQRVVPSRAQELGFQFRTTSVQQCLEVELVKEVSSSFI